MKKLYARIENVLHYHEAWVDGNSIIEHWGIVGDKGQTQIHPRDHSLPERTQLSLILNDCVSRGFGDLSEITKKIVVEYKIHGFGSPEDLEKRFELENLLNETLGWAGLGSCDGGSAGSDTMEVFCDVIDVPLAKKVTQETLAGSKFSNYTRITEKE